MRQIDNQFWNRRSIHQLTMTERYVYLYLQTSPEANVYGVYILPPDCTISARTGLTKDEVQNALMGLISKKMINITGDYVILYGYYESQPASKSPTWKKGLESFRNDLEEVVRYAWDNPEDLPLPPLPKQAKQPEPLLDDPLPAKPKAKKPTKDEKYHKEITELIVPCMNVTWGKRYKPDAVSKTCLQNYTYWRQLYEIDDIAKAIRKCRFHKFWKDKMKPELLFRQRSPRGDTIDYISELMNTPPVDDNFSNDTDFDEFEKENLIETLTEHGDEYSNILRLQQYPELKTKFPEIYERLQC